MPHKISNGGPPLSPGSPPKADLAVHPYGPAATQARNAEGLPRRRNPGDEMPHPGKPAPWSKLPVRDDHQFARTGLAGVSLDDARSFLDLRREATRVRPGPDPRIASASHSSGNSVSGGSTTPSSTGSSLEETVDRFPPLPDVAGAATSGNPVGGSRLDAKALHAATNAIRRGKSLGEVLDEHNVGHWRDQALLSDEKRRLQGESRHLGTPGGIAILRSRLENLTDK